MIRLLHSGGLADCGDLLLVFVFSYDCFSELYEEFDHFKF
jgi:hypothetical protein